MANVTIGINAEDRASAELDKVSRSIDKALVGALQSGKVSSQDFGAALLAAGEQSGLTSRQLEKMAESSGLFSESQLQAGRNAELMTAKAQELAGAVQRGEMTSREAGAAFGEYAKTLGTVQQETEKTNVSFMEMKAKFDLLKEGAQIMGQTFQQAFDLGKMGATNEQIAAAFDALIAQSGAATDTLAQMDAAVKGTVDDEELMASATSLLAGSTGELRKEYAAALPQLAEMAKAANKLNPSMGTTSQILEDINRGLKTGRFMMLERLGITVDATTAQKIYAEALGKDVERLTEEEKAMATLNQVLQSGSTLIQQVGGDVSAATDKYMKWETQLGNLKDTLAEGVNPVMNDALTSLTSIVGIMQNAGFETGILTASWEMLQGVVSDLAWNILGLWKTIKGEGAGFDFVTWDEMLQRANRRVQDVKDASENAEPAVNNFSAALANTADNAEEVSLKIDGTALATKSLKQQAEEAAGGLQVLDWEVGEGTKKMAEMEAAELAAAAAALEVERANTLLQAGLAGVLLNTEEMNGQLLDTQNQMAAVQDEINNLLLDGLDPNSEAIRKLDAEYWQLDEKAKGLADSMREATAEMIYQQASAGLDAESSLKLARAMGMLSEQDYAVASAVQAIRDQYDAGAMSADEYAARVQNLNEEINGMQRRGEEITGASLAEFTAPGTSGLGGGNLGNIPGGGVVNNNAYNVTIDAGLVLPFTDADALKSFFAPIIREVVRGSFEVTAK